MGRELKRVPLNFHWPIGQVWTGYRNPWNESPHRETCSTCDGHGSTAGMQRLEDLVSLLMLSGSDAACGKCHPYFEGMEGLHHSLGKVPSKDLAELTARLAGRPADGPLGHDACDRWSAVRMICKAARLPRKWGYCSACDGHGHIYADAATKRRASSWRRKEPPKGVGYQLWETTSEGSPVSPVCKTPEALADWLVAHPKGITAHMTRDQWLKFINGPGWAPTLIVGPSIGVQPGTAL